MRCRIVICLAIVAAIGIVTLSGASAGAVGYWNMPGSHVQHLGWGYGPGYHAPLLLGPIRFDGWHMHNAVRLPCAPNPYCACGYLESCGCGQCSDCAEQPTSLELETMPTAPVQVPQAAPASFVPVLTPDQPPAPKTPKSALFRLPVQY